MKTGSERNGNYLSRVADEKKRRKRTKGRSEGRAIPSSTSRVSTGPGSSKPSARYTPPVPVKLKRSSRIAPILMFLFFGLGVAIILFNYLPGAPLVGMIGGWVGLPTSTDNSYLLIGLLCICIGFGAATRYH
jgi:hypothetical protein